jgi:hypothetical protein
VRVVAVPVDFPDGTPHVPVGVMPYRPASRLAKGKADPAFHTKPDLAWTLIKEARAAGIPFRLVVADSVYGENARLEAGWFAARILYIMGLRPSHGTWQWVEDPKHPPAFTPAEAAQRLPKRGGPRTVRRDEPLQGTGPLCSRTGVGERLWPDLWDPPGSCDDGPEQAGSRQHLVSHGLLVYERCQY